MSEHSPQGYPPSNQPSGHATVPQAPLPAPPGAGWPAGTHRPHAYRPGPSPERPRIRPHGAWYVVPSLFVVAAVIVASISGVLWARSQALTSATDALLTQGFLQDDEVGLDEGSQYRVRAAVDAPSVRCDFTADDGAPPFTWTFTVPPSERGSAVTDLGTFTAPHTGFYRVACLGADGHLRVDPDPGGTIATLLWTGVGLILVAIGLFVGLAVARSRYRAGLANPLRDPDVA